MDKRELYEHLAKIYLDSSKQHQKKKQDKQYLIKLKHLYIGLVFFALIVIPFIFIKIHPVNKKVSSGIYHTALVIQPDAVKINYNFLAAKKEIYTLPLKDLDLSTYKALAFSVRRTKANSSVSLRVEFVNSYNERSETYIREIPRVWQDYTIDLASLKKITDWSKAKELLFIAEEWNTKEKHDVLYIENVRFLK